jgi:hypothetical protein
MFFYTENTEMEKKIEEPKLRLLAIGKDAVRVAEQLYPDAEVESSKVILPQVPKKWEGKFDRILAYHALQRVPNLAVLQTLNAWRNCLKPGGELHLFVPSFEWAARTLINDENPSPLLLIHVCGSQVDEQNYNLSLHTMRSLRIDMAQAGMVVRDAIVGEYMEAIGDEVYTAEHHYVVGVKGKEDPCRGGLQSARISEDKERHGDRGEKQREEGKDA